MGTLSSIKYRFKTADMLMKIIYINIAAFLILRITGIVCYFSGIDTMSFLSFVELPSSFTLLAERCWTLITYMFAHYDIMHILFNMLVLYWFGRMFLEFFTPKQFCGLYIIGGIGGGLLYLAAYNLLPSLSGSTGWLIGASASVMAIVLAISTKIPEYKLNLLFLGPISLKWIAIFYVTIDLLSINGTNVGGHVAHLGGALVGFLFTLAINKGTDITAPLNRIIDFFTNIKNPFKNLQFKKQSSKKGNDSKKVDNNQYSNNTMSKEDEQTLDIILDKIKKSGYSSLSEAEKRRLFQVSSKKQ